MKIALNIRFVCLLTVLLVCSRTGLVAQSPENDARMDWWRNAKFGMFIHWGLYAVPAGEYNGKTAYGEWIMNEAQIPVAEYEKFAAQFNPEKFNADEWVLMAKNAGMKYIVVTSKHHDGFCLWDTKTGDYNVVKRTPFKRDILKELSASCKKYGIAFCLYYSIMDWHHPDANKAGFDRYREEYMKPQLKELLENYDPKVLWFDGEWIAEWTDSQGKDLYNWLRRLKPGIIINNRVGKGRNGMQGMNKEKAVGDFGTPEQQILSNKSDLDWESCMTMNDHWGFNKNDTHWKTGNALVWNLVDVVAKGGNYLLNVGPTSAGLFPDSSIRRLEEIGDWMKVNHEAVYGIKTWEDFQEGSNIRYGRTKKGEVLLYCNNWPGNQLVVKKIKPLPGTAIRLLGSREKLDWKQTAEGTVILLPPSLQKAGSRPAEAPYVFQLKGTRQALAATPQVGTDAESAIKSKVVASNSALVSMSSKEKNAVIHYITDGSIPSMQSPVYTKPIPVLQRNVIKAVAYLSGKMPSEVSELQISRGKYAISMVNSYALQYAAGGPVALVDNKYGDVNNINTDWMGFEGKSMEVTVDLGAVKSFSKVSCSFLRNHGNWIFFPVKLTVLTAEDGKQFRLLGETDVPLPHQPEEIDRKEISLSKPATARYIKVIAENIKICPSWHAGNGGKAWLFADEITVE